MYWAVGPSPRVSDIPQDTTLCKHLKVTNLLKRKHQKPNHIPGNFLRPVLNELQSTRNASLICNLRCMFIEPFSGGSL